jgi:DNA end-binding protein Ku
VRKAADDDAAPPDTRGIWKGNITFGFVEIPVELRPAERSDREIHARYLDRRDMQPVGTMRINKKTGKEVPWGEVVRGFEHGRGRFVVLTDEELKHADSEAARTVEIVGFVELSEIDPFFFDRPYYLTPLSKSGKGYALLHETLRRTGKAGIAKVVLRTRQYVAAVVAHGPAIALVLLRYAGEILDPETAGIHRLDLKAMKISDAELKLAEQIVDGMMREWDPDEFHDDYREHVLELVARKARTGKTAVVEETAEEGERSSRRGAVVDLMPLLKKSLESARGRRAAHGARRKATGA